MYYPMVLNPNLSQKNLFSELEKQGYDKEDLFLLLPNSPCKEELEITKVDVANFPLVFIAYDNSFQCSSLAEFAGMYLQQAQLYGELYFITYKNDFAIVSLPDSSIYENWYDIRPADIFLGHIFQGNIYLEYFWEKFPEETFKKLEEEICYLQQNFADKTA